MARYKVTKEQLERVVESFVMESAKKSVNKKSISEDYGMTEEELNEFFGKKRTPEELVQMGQKIAGSDTKAKAIYNTIKRDESKYGENAANKYLMFIAQTKGQMLYATWKKDLEAPDGTMGYWVERGKPRSGYDVQTTQLQ